MSRYASRTKTASNKSKGEIEHLLEKYGAVQIVTATDGKQAMIMFDIGDGPQMRRVRFKLDLRVENDVAKTATGLRRTGLALKQAIEREQRVRWRGLLLLIKSKLVAVTENKVVFEDEFLAYIMLPDGQTVAEKVSPLISKAYESGRMPKLLSLLPD